MKRFIYVVFVLSLLVFTAACVRSDNGQDTTGPAPSVTTEEQTTIEDTTEETGEETTVPVTTEADTTAPVTTVPVTTSPETTTPPVTTTPPPSSDPAYVTYPINNVNGGATFTGLPVLSNVDYTVTDPYNSRGLSTVRNPFSFGVAKDGQPHSITVNNQKTFDSYGTNALAWDNKSGEKVLYLTFDCGYKYGELTSQMLDTLKEKNVKAAFFCTMDYLDDEPAVIARMIAEGHIVGNHTTTHPDCTTISRTQFARELLGVHNYMRVNFGYTPKYFRFPTGAFSQNSIDLANSVGYRSVFWSVAYADWDPQSQQGTEVAYSQVTSRLHPGAVILLHSTSPDNAVILGRVIDYAREQGYVFKSLDEYAYWK